jgi:hypothetical protein
MTTPANKHQLEYIPFQTLPKAKAYKILNYGRSYDKYTRFRISENPELITDIYVDDEPYIMFTPQDGSTSASTLDESQMSFHVEIHYAPESAKTIRTGILTNGEIDLLIEKYGCKL